jgi:two-component system LytT family sensor kinase
MQKHRFLRYHVIGWLASLIYSVAGVYFFPTTLTERDFPGRVFIFLLSYQLSLMGVFYYCYSLILPGFAGKTHRWLYITGAVLVPFLFVPFRFTLEQVVEPFLFGFSNYPMDISISFYIPDNIYRGTPAVFFSIAAWSLERSYKKEQEIKQLKQENTTAELEFLRSQVNPHFLYNTLNYIYSQAIPVSDKLAGAIMKLSKMMRYLLHESISGRVDILQETDYLENYVAFYRLRFRNQCFADFHLAIMDESLSIAPLLLIPFVENAFKHGVLNDPGHPVKIDLQTQDKTLTLNVSNRISRQQKDGSSGIGLINVQRRLELLYPCCHQLLITQNEDTYQTQLTINL